MVNNLNNKTVGVIYILTNPSFRDYVKIGYADDVERRLKELNRSECIPFAFRVYATYAVTERLKDLKLHDLIDKLNPSLRSIDTFGGQKRIREFYAMSPEDAYNIFEAIAEINGHPERLKKWELTRSDEESEQIANEISIAASERCPNFTFSQCNIAVGEEIEFISDNSIRAKTVDDKNVEYNGEIYSLSGLVRLLTGSTSRAIHSPRYFSYKGEPLNDIRRRNGF